LARFPTSDEALHPRVAAASRRREIFAERELRSSLTASAPVPPRLAASGNAFGETIAPMPRFADASDRWPELPEQQPAADADWSSKFAELQHRKALDLEQRGKGRWNA
jgi:hypothetical protein